MIRCRRCGTENLDDSAYCDDCGASLAPEAGDTRTVSVSGLVGPQEPLATSEGFSEAVSSTSPSPTGGRPRAKLVVLSGHRLGREFLIAESEVLIGRWDAEHGIFPEVDLDKEDPEATVSRRHARIFYREGRFWIEDLGSLNGTFVNRGPRLRPGHAVLLQHGDEIVVGKTFLRFLIEGV